jgi:hypothetical protein
MQRGSRISCDSKRNDRLCPLGPLPDYNPDTAEEGSERVWRFCHGWRLADVSSAVKAVGGLAEKYCMAAGNLEGQIPMPRLFVAWGIGVSALEAETSCSLLTLVGH